MAVGRGRFPRIGGGQGIAPRFSNGCEPASRGARERRRPLYAEMVVILAELWSDLWRKVDITRIGVVGSLSAGSVKKKRAPTKEKSFSARMQPSCV